MAPVVHGLEIEYWGEVDFAYLDIQDPATQEFRNQFGFRYQPYLVFVDGEGNVIGDAIGYQDEANLRAKIEQLVSS